MSPQPANPSVAFPGPAVPRHPAPEDLVLFAMQLYPPDEAAAVAKHLERCAECRAELGRIRSDLALTAFTVDLHAPPAEARQRLLQQVAREKKIVPIAQPQPPAEPQPVLASFGRTASVLAIEDHPHRRRSYAFAAVSGWLFAIALAFAAVFQYEDRQGLRSRLAEQGDQIQRLNADAASAHQLMDALTDPRAERFTLSAKPQIKTVPVASLTYNPDKGSLIFLASNLDPLQAYKTYELWVIPASGAPPVPAGTFHPDDQGNASVIMPDLPKGIAAKSFGVTIEPDGGSQAPTTPIIISGN